MYACMYVCMYVCIEEHDNHANFTPTHCVMCIEPTEPATILAPKKRMNISICMFVYLCIHIRLRDTYLYAVMCWFPQIRVPAAILAQTKRMYVCMYVCIHVCTYACVKHIYMHILCLILAQLTVPAAILAPKHWSEDGRSPLENMSLPIFACMYTCVCVYACMCVCVYNNTFSGS
jgi:hypothetical protein